MRPSVLSLCCLILACSHPRPVVIIGWDGASWNILEPLREQGRLPTLHALMSAGAWGSMESTPLYVSPPAWVSLYSGKNPGKTGIFHFGHRVSPFSFDPLSSEHVRTARLWDIATHLGRTCCLVNVPLTYPVPPVKGVAIADEFAPCLLANHRFITVRQWDQLPGPDRVGRARVQIHETVLDMVVDVFNPTPWMTLTVPGTDSVVVGPRIPHRTWSPWIRVRVGGREGEARVCLQWLQATEVTLWVSPVYRLIHDFHPPVAHPPSWAETLLVHHGRFLPYVRWHWEPAVEHVAWLGAVAQRAMARRFDFFSCVFLAPDHMQHQYGDGPETQRVLEELDRVTGLLLSKVPRRALVVLVSDHGFQRFSWRVDLNAWLASLGLCRFDSSGAVLPRESLAWSTMWGVYLNEALAGDSLPQVVQRLAEQASSLLNPVTGKPMGLRLLPREQVYTGPFVAQAPHLVVSCQGDHVPEFWDYKNVGPRSLVRPTRPDDAWDHAPCGIFVLAGPGVKRASRVQLSIYDIAPTVLAWAGIPIPSGVDGRVAEELFTSLPPITWHASYPRLPVPSLSVELPLEERLRALGYVQ